MSRHSARRRRRLNELELALALVLAVWLPVIFVISR